MNRNAPENKYIYQNTEVTVFVPVHTNPGSCTTDVI